MDGHPKSDSQNLSLPSPLFEQTWLFWPRSNVQEEENSKKAAKFNTNRKIQLVLFSFASNFCVQRTELTSDTGEWQYKNQLLRAKRPPPPPAQWNANMTYRWEFRDLWIWAAESRCPTWCSSRENADHRLKMPPLFFLAPTKLFSTFKMST